MTRSHKIDLDEYLIDMEERNQGLDWPLAVDLWLEQRVQQARAVGLRTTRKELSAALLTWHLPTDDELVKLLLRYRTSTARNLLGATEDGENVVAFERHGPGPRRASDRR